jgi:predicted phage terminase large subunit-like protein
MSRSQQSYQAYNPSEVAIRQRELELERERRRRARKQEARNKFAKLSDFARAAWPVLEPTTPLKWGWHLDCICEHLEAVTNNEIKKLIINIAPRHGKSLFTSVFWPAWTWLHDPSLRWLSASYAMNLSVKLSVDCRRLIESPFYQNECLPDFQLTSDQNVKSHFDNSKRGSRFATAMTAVAGGFGCSVLLLDDPHNRSDASSPLEIKASIEGYRFNLFGCLNDKITGRQVLIMQRICVGDLTDELLSQGGWEHLCLPTENDNARRSTSLGFYDQRTVEKELLCPAQFDQTANEDAKKTLGIQGYSAQHSQNPTPDGGVLFDISKFKYINAQLIPRNLRRHTHWDLAATAETPGKDPDFTAGVTMGVDDNDHRIFITNVDKFRVDPAECELKIKNRAIINGVETSITLEEEKASAGKHVASYYTRHVLIGFVVKGQPIHGDKIARARPFAAQVNAGNVYLIEGAYWLHDFLDELKDWPNGKHKDQGDGCSGAFNQLFDPEEAALTAAIQTKQISGFTRPAA